MQGYKGFDKDLKCRNKQYKVGSEYKEKEAKLCESGFHFCEHPLDVLKYYAPNDSRYCDVNAFNVSNEKSDDTKRVAKRIKINAEIGIIGLAKASVEYIKNNIDWDKDKIYNTGNYSASTNTGEYSASTNTGDQSASTNTGYRSVSTNTGNYSASTNTGNYSVSTNTGNYSASTNTGHQSASTNTGNRSVSTNTGNYSASTNTGNYSVSTNTGHQSASTNTGNRSVSTNTGNYSASTNTGNYSASTNTGNRSVSTNTGNCSVSTNTGNYSVSTVDGKESVAISLGMAGKAKANKGSWIVLAEWKIIDEEYYRTDVACFQVDGEKVKENTFYVLKNGELKEA